jgi:hypothetical protein
MKTIITFICLVYSLTLISQGKFENLYLSVGFGFNQVKSKYWTTIPPSGTRLTIKSRSDEFFTRPIRLGYHHRFLSYDITYVPSYLLKQISPRIFSSLHSNVEVSIPRLLKKPDKLDYSIGVRYSFLYRSKPYYDNNNYFGTSVTVGTRKLKLRYCIERLVDSESFIASKNRATVSGLYWSLDMIYCIYPFHKKEKKRNDNLKS